MSDHAGVESPIDRQLAEVFRDLFGVDSSKLGDKASVETLEGWDSLGHLHLIIAIEERFSISLSPEEVLAMTDYASVRRIVLLKRLGGLGNSG